jgi:hypothetical protein
MAFQNEMGEPLSSDCNSGVEVPKLEQKPKPKAQNKAYFERQRRQRIKRKTKH